jgi:hypothetical protein
MDNMDELIQKLFKMGKLAAVSPAELAADYEEDDSEWYNVRIEEVDFPTLALLENLKLYSFCRCHLEEEDGSSNKEHMHALVKFVGHPTLQEFRKALGKTGEKLQRSTIFRKIICLDHAVGVLHYLSCDRGRKPYSGNTLHIHYCRTVFDDKWLHKRLQYKCKKIRNEISKEAALGVNNLDMYESAERLHDYETCHCNNGMEKTEE